MNNEIDILKRALAREKSARKSAERILEEKSRDLYRISQKLETLLAEKSAQLQGVFENIIDAYVIIGIDGDILKFNDAAKRLFEYNIDEEPINVVQLIFPEDHEYAMNSFLDLKKYGYFKNYEARVLTKSGEVKWVHINASIVYDVGRVPIAAQGIVRDITEIKNLEVQKEKLLKKLEGSNDLLQEYAHIVSHDLKSPLRSIDALVHWIKEDNQGQLDETTIQNFKLIETALEKMELLITDLLDYASIGAKDTLKEEVNLNDLMRDLQSILFIPDHIKVIMPKKMPTVIGDPIKLQQLFQNLIGNAIKFSDKTKGEINIDVIELEGYYQFSIKDNGIGIDQKFHNKIFEIFHSLNKSKSSTGIGLSIVKKIVDMHGGKIWLNSELDFGTTFYFTIEK